MKNQTAYIGYGLALLSLAASSAGCKSRPAPAKPAASQPVAAQPPSAVAATVLIRAKGATAGRIERQDSAWLLSADGMESITCQSHDARKSRCRTASGAAVAELKFNRDDASPEEGAIKLVSPDGKLRWKLRFSREKIKLSNNEENRESWTISLKHEGKVKVENPKEQEVGVFRRSDDSGNVENAGGETLFTLEGAGRSAFPALLLVPDLTPTDRLILSAEMLARGL